MDINRLFFQFLIAILLMIKLVLSVGVDIKEYLPNLVQDADGRIETLNNKGSMSPTATKAEMWLIEDLAKQKNNKDLRLLEIGPAFGRLPIELFLNGFQGHYTAIDLSEKHLNFLNIALKKIKVARNKFNTIVGVFPNDTKFLPPRSLDIIILTHVFHFFGSVANMLDNYSFFTRQTF